MSPCPLVPLSFYPFTHFPVAHWKNVGSTNPLERLNKEFTLRTDVVGGFPNPEALMRLAAPC